MTQSTEKERAEFEVWAKSYGRIFIERDAAGSYKHQFTQEAWVGWQERARRAPVVPQTLSDEFSNCLKRCRNAFPVPVAGTDLERLWLLALDDVTYVPDYIEALAAAPQPPEGRQVPELSVERKAMHTAMCTNPDASLEGLEARWSEAAPVELPEPKAWIWQIAGACGELGMLQKRADFEARERLRAKNPQMSPTEAIYTEQQVRALLAGA